MLSGLRSGNQIFRSILGRVTVGVWCLVGLSVSAAENWTQETDGIRSRSLSLPETAENGFETLAVAGALTQFSNQLATALYRTNQVILNGSGVSLGDVNGDDLPDVYVTGLEGDNGLFINRGGWDFEDVTAVAGVGCPGSYSTGSVLADLDGDGRSDLVVCSIQSETRVFRNLGNLRFQDVTEVAALNSGLGGMSVTVGDYDRDGLLDLYVANYRASALMDIPNAKVDLGVRDGKQIVTRLNGRSVSEPDLANRFYIDERGGLGEYGEVDGLYRNLGDFRFERISFDGGRFFDSEGQPLTEPVRDWGLAAMFRDINRDGWPDLYVCNDFDTPDRIWINQGDGSFRALEKTAMRQSSWFSMGVDFADVNRDGRDDFLTLDMLGRTHRNRMTQLGDMAPPAQVIRDPLARPQFLKTCLFLGTVDGNYSEVGQFAGLADTDWAWCPAFVDVDLDGWEDLLVTNGNERDGRNLDVAAILKALRAQRTMTDDEIFTERMRFDRLATPNLAYRNNGDGTFSEVGAEWGFDFVGVSHGMALGDLDNDGDLDAVVNHLNAPLGVYRNRTSKPRVRVRLRGMGGNTAAIGARVRLEAGEWIQEQEIQSGNRYLGSDDATRTFAVPDGATRLVLTVRWPDGGEQRIEEVKANHIYEISQRTRTVPEMNAPSEQASPEGVGSPLFEDISDWVGSESTSELFDDFGRQPLLLRGYSDLGPGVSWYDVDSDGFEDLLVGTGRGGRLGVFRNNEGKGFGVYDRAPFDRVVNRDTTTVLGAHLKASDPSLIVGLSNYEDGVPRGAVVGQYRFRAATPTGLVPADAASVGPLALADVDGDGDLDLFVGKRVTPGRIPDSAPMQLWRQENGTFRADPQAFENANVGMISGAVFTDLDSDHDPDLVVAVEWGPLVVLENVAGRFRTPALDWGLGGYRGWWNGVQAGDFNNDGRMDLVATNWGLNSPYRRYEQDPLQLYYGDFDGNGQGDLLVGVRDRALDRVVPIRQLGLLVAGLPSLRQAFTSYETYAQASSQMLLDILQAKPTQLEVNWWASTVFLNQGNGFNAIALPSVAQWSPAFGVSVADFNADGFEDLFLAQNFFGVRRDVARYDAGNGLLLRGDGSGRFEPVSVPDSGIRMLGEQRGAAVADLDHDARVDLVVGQSGGAVRVFRNQAPAQGIHVRLQGPEGNPSGVGASLWLSDGSSDGPRKEVRAGAGYWSQDGMGLVLTHPRRGETLHVRWPDGEQLEYALPAGARVVTVRPDGQLALVGGP